MDMKKLLNFAALAALLLPVSCKDQDVQVKTVLPAPIMAEHAKKLILGQNDKSDIQFIELTESGHYLVKYQKPVKSNEGDNCISDSYAHTGSAYDLNKFGSIQLDGNQLTINESGKPSFTVPVTVENKLPQSDFFTTICRSWKVDLTDISVKVGHSDVGIRKSGCNLEEITKDLVGKGVSVAYSFEGIKVDRIIFTSSKTFMVKFSNGMHFVGLYSIKDDGTFGYDFDHVGNDYFNASAHGNISDTDPYKSGQTGKIWLIMSVNMTSGGQSHAGQLKLTLSPIQ